MRSKYYGIHEKSVKQRSITPETYKGDRVQFIKSKIYSLVSKSNVEDELFYVDQYQYKGSTKSHVFHFGINIYLDGIQQEVIEYNKLKKDKFELKSLSKGSEDKRLGAMLDFKNKAQNTLTNNEKLVVNEAINHLKNFKTVLVDFFVRDADNIIQLDKQGIPEVHTVVLYNQNNKFLLIDPSNTIFSYILAGAHPDILLCINEQMQIYKPISSDKIGPNPDNWRDCIDIAVKLSFALNSNKDIIKINTIKHQLQTVEVIEFESLANSSSIKDLTNQKSLYTALPSDTKEYPLRAKQSSDIKESAITTFFLKSISNTILQIEEKLSNINPYRLLDVYSKKREESFSDINKPIHEEFIEQLFVCDKYLKSEYGKILENPNYVQEQELELIGHIDN